MIENIDEKVQGVYENSNNLYPLLREMGRNITSEDKIKEITDTAVENAKSKLVISTNTISGTGNATVVDKEKYLNALNGKLAGAVSFWMAEGDYVWTCSVDEEFRSDSRMLNELGIKVEGFSDEEESGFEVVISYSEGVIAQDGIADTELMSGAELVPTFNSTTMKVEWKEGGGSKKFLHLVCGGNYTGERAFTIAVVTTSGTPIDKDSLLVILSDRGCSSTLQPYPVAGSFDNSTTSALTFYTGVYADTVAEKVMLVGKDVVFNKTDGTFSWINKTQIFRITTDFVYEL